MTGTDDRRLSPEDAERLVRARWGIAGRAEALSSERDQNFRIETASGRRVLLKIADPAEARQVTNFQTELLLHLERTDPQLPAPRILRTPEGAAEIEISAGAPLVARMLSFLDGTPLATVAARSPRQRRRIGERLGRLGTALAGFRHPADEHELIWDMAGAARLRDLLGEIEDADRRALAAAGLDRFDRVVAPALPGLRRQVIHADANPSNILVDPADPDTITGLIDFGDAVRTVLATDVAVAAAYHLSDGDDPLGPAGELIAGYHDALPLQPQEIDLLCDLMATRLVMIVVIGAWRARRHPENRDYILRNNQTAWARLRRLADLDRQEAAGRLHRICREEIHG
ncbi:phosphotransferase [Mycobacterium sp. KBS0706]|uniref:phosphotransferase n=1 Tax=Mycobacterium sp. KBS0706 TaxID=2578109 RepID=UPI00110F858F|nr:phosphotransferase [Mycobacterium sp. KBS0706]TSD90503.1 phosphotransferase [Mycobacterium sp. KBS0706]